MYDKELRGTGLRATQFTLLQALEFAGEITQGRLGTILSIDSTTLTRSLQALIDEGWVHDARGDDRRERYLRLTAAGRRKLEAAMPAWRRAQERLKKVIGRNWEAFDADLRRITGSVG